MITEEPKEIPANILSKKERELACKMHFRCRCLCHYFTCTNLKTGATIKHCRAACCRTCEYCGQENIL